MQKIGSITPTADANGEWTNGNVAAGISPTLMDAAWFNTIQRELANIVTGGGLTLDPANDAQVIAALKKIFLQSGNNLSEISAVGAVAQATARSNISAAALSGLATQVFSVATATANNHAVTLAQMNTALGLKAALAGLATQVFSVATATANAHAVPLSQMNTALALKAFLAGDPNTAFQVANNGTGAYAVNNDRLNFVLQSYAALAGNQYTSFNVGGATAATHAVRLDQFQSGNNGNGAWVNHPGGSQWCRQNLTLAANATTTWTYPAGFVSAPAVFITAINGAFQCWLNGVGANNCGIYNNGAALNVNILAIY